MAVLLLTVMAVLAVTEMAIPPLGEWWSKHTVTAAILVYLLGLGLVYLAIEARSRANWRPATLMVSARLDDLAGDLVAGLMLQKQGLRADGRGPNAGDYWGSLIDALLIDARLPADIVKFHNHWQGKVRALSDHERMRLAEALEDRLEKLRRAVLEAASILVAGGAPDLLNGFQRFANEAAFAIGPMRSYPALLNSSSTYRCLAAYADVIRMLREYRWTVDTELPAGWLHRPTPIDLSSDDGRPPGDKVASR
jgi:hypothetical protein